VQFAEDDRAQRVAPVGPVDWCTSADARLELLAAERTATQLIPC